jgi:hypothetical protein
LNPRRKRVWAYYIEERQEGGIEGEDDAGEGDSQASSM